MAASGKKQKRNKTNLLKTIGTIKYLAGQGLESRSHEEVEGNFYQLFKFRASDDLSLQNWLKRKRNNYISWEIQNEILNIFSSTIVMEIADKVRQVPTMQFSMMINGTPEAFGTEQEFICLK